MGILVAWAVRLGTWIFAVLATKQGQALASWLLGYLWKIADGAIKDKLAAGRVREHVRQKLKEYDAIIERVRIKAEDGLTEEEINEAEKEKIAVEEDITNFRP